MSERGTRGFFGVDIVGARDTWLSRDIKDGVATPDLLRTVRTRAEIQDALRRTWGRLEAFLRDQANVDATYATPWETTNGHWLAFHALEHDIHHRADIFHYLGMLRHRDTGRRYAVTRREIPEVNEP